MISRFLSTKVSRVQARAFSAKKPFSKDAKAPAYNPIEFEPFKFERERNQIFHGYSFQELFGKAYGEKHSNLIRKEMNKDNIVFWVLISAILYLAVVRKERIEEFE
jgi:hypothetical protein